MGLTRENRKCLKCDVGDDEHHLLFICRLYESEHSRFITSCYIGSQTQADVYKLLLCEDAKLLNNVCVFIRHCLKVHHKLYKGVEFKNSNVVWLKDAILINM